MESEKSKSHRELAEEIFAHTGPMSADTPGLEASAILGVGHALLAIHDELRAIRLKYDPPAKGPGTVGFSSMGA